MSIVIVIFKVYPEEGALESVTDKVKQLSPQDMKVEDLAFGIKILKAAFKFNDEQTNSSAIEEKLAKLEGVSQVEVEEETLL
jgi:translation elongation factor EF-1beta